jgi:dTDP-4-dehydrorhamnose 3,5-epimerase
MEVRVDERGYFKEVHRGDFKQANQSFSKKGVVRGLHYQEPQVTKLVWVTSGKIYDVIFNLETGEHTGKILSADNHQSMLVPKGYAHGFQALEDSVVCYLVSEEYNPSGDRGINPSIVDWPLKEQIISKKDREATWSY